MPNIQLFQTPSTTIRPSETGIETVAGNARRMGAFYHEEAGSLEQLAGQEGQAYRSVGRALGTGIEAAGDAYVNYLDHKEISAGAAKGTALMANLEDQWNQKISDPNLDPNDPAIKQKFMAETLEPQLQKFVDGSGYFSTDKSQQFAESFIDRFRQHMENKTSADMSTLAGIALKTNVQTTVNSLSSMVASDPSSLDFALQSADHAIGSKVDSAPTLDATTKASVRSEVGLKAKQDIVKSAVIGLIQKNPNVDLDAIQKKYGDYINGAEMKMFQKSAQVQARAEASAAKQDALMKRQLADQNMHAGSNKVMSDNVTIDPQTQRPVISPKFYQDTLDLARKNPDAPSAAGTVRTMLDWAESQQNKDLKAVDNPTVTKDLSDRMFSPDNPTTALDLMKARAAGQISDHTFNTMHGLVKELSEEPLKEPIWHDTVNAVKSELILSNVGLPGKDIAGEGNYAKWAQTFIPQYLAAKRAGTLQPNALDVKDPTSMISQSMAPFKRSVSQRAQDYLSVLGGNSPAAPGAPTAAPTVTSKAQYDALASGATYIGSDGKTYRKP